MKKGKGIWGERGAHFIVAKVPVGCLFFLEELTAAAGSVRAAAQSPIGVRGLLEPFLHLRSSCLAGRVRPRAANEIKP